AGGGYPCTSEFKFGDRIFHNWQPENKTISLAQALVESCDTVFYNFARSWWSRDEHQVGLGNTPPEVMQMYARMFGLGSDTGIDLPEGTEDPGRIPDRAWRKEVWEANKSQYCATAHRTGDPLFQDLCERGYLWRGGDSINMSIGQGDVQVSPLQLADAYAAIANGGTLVRPHLGARVLGPGGKVSQTFDVKPRARVDAAPSVIEYVQRALAEVPVKGTARYPFRSWPLAEIPMAAKTGSAEIVGKQPFSWFASYGPANDPRYVVVAVVEQAGHGAQVAGPIVRRIFDELLDRPPLPIVYGGKSD
ncbi:MAG: penicillin-binding transpeptidase domain-containing protein, partial [Actinomycetota bacterium]